MQTQAMAALVGVMAAGGAFAAGQQSAVPGGVYKELVMSVNRTTALVSPGTGQVSADFLVNLVNAGQQNEYMEQGVSDSSANTSYTVPAVANSIGPGQTAYVTVTVRGTGGGFPYWIDYWAQIAGAPDTRKTERFVIDTLGTGVNRLSHPGSRPDGLRLTVLGDRGVTLSAAPGTHLSVFQPNGRQVWSWAAGGEGARVSQSSTCPVLVRVRSDDRASSATVLPW